MIRNNGSALPLEAGMFCLSASTCTTRGWTARRLRMESESYLCESHGVGFDPGPQRSPSIYRKELDQLFQKRNEQRSRFK